MEFGILTIVHSDDDDLVTTFVKNVAMLTLREKLWKMSHSLTEKMSAGGDTNLSAVVAIGRKLGVDPTMLLQKQDPTPPIPLDLDKEPWHGISHPPGSREPVDIPEPLVEKAQATKPATAPQRDGGSTRYDRREAIFEILKGSGKTAKDIQDRLTEAGNAYGGKAPQNTASAALIHMVKRNLLVSKELGAGSRAKVFYLPNCPSLKANEKELRAALVRRVLLEVDTSPAPLSSGDVVRALSEDKPGDSEPRATFVGTRPQERCRRLLNRLAKDGLLQVSQGKGTKPGCVGGTLWFSSITQEPAEVTLPEPQEIPESHEEVDDYSSELDISFG